MTHRTTTALGVAAATLGLALPATASAHVTVQPTELPAGGYSVVDVRVPNEQDDKGTLKVELQLPPGVSYAAYQPVPNWTATIATRKPARPLSIDGKPVPEEVSTITWTGKGKAGVIAPGQFLQFPVSLRVPDGTEGTRLTFKALQTYEGGEVVRWIGTPDADHPAPTVTLEEAEDEHGGGQHAAAGGSGTPAAAVAADDSDDDDGSDAFPIALGGAGLLAGLAGFAIALAGRRKSA